MSRAAPLHLGFVALADAAALIVAREKGMFANEHLEVSLSRETSWATLRDKLSIGVLDGAHMLAPLAVAMGVGAGCDPTPMIVPLELNRGGAAVTISSRMVAALGDGDPGEGLARVISRRREQQSSPLTFGVVHPQSLHNYLLRDWLGNSGIDPDEDVRLTVVAPARTAELLAGGVIEGFCAGEPWNQVAVRAGVGAVVVRASALTPDAPDKVFAVTAAWAGAHISQLRALLRSLLRASAWCDAPENRDELATLLARPNHLGVEREAIADGLRDIRFHGPEINRPDPAHGQWLFRRLMVQGPDSREAGATQALLRPDLYEQALSDIQA